MIGLEMGAIYFPPVILDIIAGLIILAGIWYISRWLYCGQFGMGCK